VYVYSRSLNQNKKQNDSLNETFIMDVRPTAMFHVRLKIGTGDVLLPSMPAL